MSTPLLLIAWLATLCSVAIAHPPGHEPVVEAPPEPPVVFDTVSIDLGPVPDSAVITRTFRFTNKTARQVRLIIGGCHHCGVPVSDKPVYQPAESGVVIVELNPLGRRGPMRSGGIVRVEGVPNFSVQLDLLAEVRPRVWFEPEPSVLTQAVRGVGSHSFCIVRGRASGFRVERATVTGEYLTATLADPVAEGTPDDPWTSQTVTIAVDPRAPSGAVSGELLIVTNDRELPQRAFAISGDVVGDALAEHDPAMLGQRDPASPFIANFLIRSRRGQPVQLLDLDVIDPGKCTSVAIDLQPALDLDGWRVSVVGFAPPSRVLFTDVIVGLRSVGADGTPELLKFNTRLSVRKDAPASRSDGEGPHGRTTP